MRSRVRLAYWFALIFSRSCGDAETAGFIVIRLPRDSKANVVTMDEISLF